MSSAAPLISDHLLRRKRSFGQLAERRLDARIGQVSVWYILLALP